MQTPAPGQQPRHYVARIVFRGNINPKTALDEALADSPYNATHRPAASHDGVNAYIVRASGEHRWADLMLRLRDLRPFPRAVTLDGPFPLARIR